MIQLLRNLQTTHQVQPRRFKMIKKILKFALIFFVITGWVFSGWPEIRIEIRHTAYEFPPRIQYALAATTTDTYATAGTTTWAVPGGVTSISVSLWGGGGGGGGGDLRRGGNAGGAGYVTGEIAVNGITVPGSITITVGSPGKGGGLSSTATSGGGGGGGGAYSAILNGTPAATNTVLFTAAGGGGGGGGEDDQAGPGGGGGVGGGATGGTGTTTATCNAGGGIGGSGTGGGAGGAGGGGVVGGKGYAFQGGMGGSGTQTSPAPGAGGVNGGGSGGFGTGGGTDTGGGGGGGGGFWGGGGGGIDPGGTIDCAAGGGGGSSIATTTATKVTNSSGSLKTPGGTGDTNYASPAGVGGNGGGGDANGSDGNAGRIVILYTIPTPPTLEQAAYLWYSNSASTSPGNAATINTSMIAPPQGTPFRLRLSLHAKDAQMDANGTTTKLQFAQKSGSTCEASGGGESYGDLTTATAIRFFDNASLTDNLAIGPHPSFDPRHSSTTGGVDKANYQSFNDGGTDTTFTNPAAIPQDEDGIWDFSLMDFSATANTSYCVIAVQNGGGLLASYGSSTIPELRTAQNLKSRFRGTVRLRTVRLF